MSSQTLQSRTRTISTLASRRGDRAAAAGIAAVEILDRGRREGRLLLIRWESQGLERIRDELEALPSDWRELQARLEPEYAHLYD